MKRLLVQSDDYGITKGVSAGIREGITYGIIRNTGLFVNMDGSEEDVKQLQNMDVCLGVDINYVCGKPVTDTSLIPDLVDENGDFISSTNYVKTHKLEKKEDGLYIFETDPFPYEQILLETENQVKRFMEYTGRLPEYMHTHSLSTPNTLKAALAVAEKYGLYHTWTLRHTYRALPGVFDGVKNAGIQEQLDYRCRDNFIQRALPSLAENETAFYVFHCGYADADLLRKSSLNLRRIRDLEAVLDSNVKDYIREEKIELITYRDLKKEK